MILSLHALKIPLTNLTPRALASSLFPPINLSLSATFIFFSASLLCFFCLLSSPLCLVLFPLSHSHIYTNAHTPFAYPPPAPEVCEVVGACESRHTERGSCVPHLKPFAQSMLSASIWICVCVSVCALVFVYVSMTRSGWGECLCQCFACTKGKALFLYTHVGETVWCTIVLLLSVPALWSHFFYLALISVCTHKTRTMSC